MKNIIDLNKYKVAGSKVFTGRDRGQYVREKSQVDNLANEAETIELVIPDDIYSINPSFLEEFLVNVVQKLGKAGFWQKFIVINTGDYKINNDLDEAIDRILRSNHALI